ncbi:zinc-dependent alcohol dehydrogenase [Tengunoibacter tsumagoiensis]|uniref:Enoyl reductase (ER) domain-containing protein n=1 Tax=Tengunoibacter tsumagoiensis TaxID=2014871 RepID=A0A401ZUG4_9CHLR|nr:alcohol dehydrogenase catalytic domain-containing protein [Tengunoibacter tsumagoiensis]GCE10390.1 hypothetical protein KTT_02490 [Tengunoibacter tsumagoiensis]
MWTSTLELDARRVLLTQLIGRFYRDAYFSSFSPLQVQNLPRQPLPDMGWVRVRNRLAGICGTDLHLIYGDADLRTAPTAVPGLRQSYPGHEIVGEVIEIGDHVQRLQVGARVALQHGPNCRAAGIQPPCRSCAHGSYNLCVNSSRIGQYAIGGGWSEEMLIHEQQLFSIPSYLSDEQAVMLEPTAVAVHAVLRRLPQPGEHILIIGAGTIGLLTLQVVKALVPQVTVSVLARHSFQVEQATRLGASHIIYPQDSYHGVQRATGAKLTHGFFGNKMLHGGYDVIYDTVGQRNTLHHALRWTRAQGTLVLVGLNLHLMHIDLTPVWYQEINLIGSTSHGTEVWPLGSQQRTSTFQVATELIQRGLLHPEQLITHHFALNNYKHALMTATNKADSRAIKVVFDYSLLPASVVPNVRAAGRHRHPLAHIPPLPEQYYSREDEEAFEAAPVEQRTPVPSAIQATPPIPPIDEATWNAAMSYVSNTPDNEDTATAMPSLRKRYSRKLPPDEQGSQEAQANDDAQKVHAPIARRPSRPSTSSATSPQPILLPTEQPSTQIPTMPQSSELLAEPEEEEAQTSEVERSASVQRPLDEDQAAAAEAIAAQELASESFDVPDDYAGQSDTIEEPDSHFARENRRNETKLPQKASHQVEETQTGYVRPRPRHRKKR